VEVIPREEYPVPNDDAVFDGDDGSEESLLFNYLDIFFIN
jgi:hypothetical protein